MNELKLLANIPFVMIATKLTWKTLSKKEKDERLSEMWVVIVLAENPLLVAGLRSIYDWCVKNYE